MLTTSAVGTPLLYPPRRCRFGRCNVIIINGNCTFKFQVDDTLSVVPIRRIVDGRIKDELCDVEWNDSEILCASIVATGSYAPYNLVFKRS